jgi:uncharacterized membrane protein YhaH (DUF805 family)
MTSIFTWYFLSFKGRISRREFFLGYLGLLVVCGLLSQLLLSVTFHNPTGRIWSARELGVALSMPFIVCVAMLLWPFFAISAKRLHDIGVSGWWLTAAVAMPFVSKFANINFSTLLLVSVTMLSSISGRPHSNRFGDQPPVQSKST